MKKIINLFKKKRYNYLEKRYQMGITEGGITVLMTSL